MAKRALITGITGQDGSYLAELLLSLNYEVHGVVRRAAIEDSHHRLERLQPILEHIHLHNGTVDNFPGFCDVLRAVKPDELYHLAAQSYVAESFDDAFTTFNTNINGTHCLLASVRASVPDCRVYFAGSSEMFGNPVEVPQRETTRFRPRSPYGISKVAGFELTRNYREQYNLFACSGILFNHESPRRSYEFVTRKITSHVARIKAGLINELQMGNLDAQRDWGHAQDYVRAIHAMLQQDKPDDFVVATGQLHTVRELVQLAFSYVNLDYREYVKINPEFIRPAEALPLVGDASKAERELGWVRRYTFEQIVEEMVEADLQRWQ